MAKAFDAPVFDNRDLEFRLEDAEIQIYGSERGLIRLAELCLKLSQARKDDHIHLEDYELLTPDSMVAVIVRFTRAKGK